MGKPCFVIVNPVSGSSSPAKIKRVVDTLADSGCHPQVLYTTNSDDATLFAQRICRDVPDPTIVIGGGDGTVNGVLNGLAPGVATVAVLPLGTSNVLARELKIRSLDDALARVAKGESRSASVGELVWGEGSRRFMLMAGVGVDGAVVEGVRLHEKRRFGKGAYLLSALRILRRWEKEEVTITSAGASVACHSVIVCNAGRYGGDFLLAPKGDVFSPGFEVVCIKGGPLDYLKLALMLGTGGAGRCRSLTSFSARELAVTGTKHIQLDGDYCRCAPATIRSLPDFMRLIV